MSKLSITIITLAVLVSCGGYFIHLAMKSAKDNGYNQCQNEHSQAVLKRVKDATDKKNEIKNRSFDDSDLARLHILRDDKDL